MALSCAVGLLLAGCSSNEDAEVADRTEAASQEADPSGPPARAVFLGDSYTAASDDGGGYVPAAAEGMGWTPVLAGVGSTGYVDPAPGSGPYATRVADVVADEPDVVVVQGSTNDVGHPVADVRAAARDLYAALGEQVPAAEVIVLGPLDPPGIDRHAVDEIRAVLSEEADAAGLTFIDPVAEDWLGSGDGLYADPVHPNEAGYAEFAAELVGALRIAGL